VNRKPDDPPWLHDPILTWISLLLDSYTHWTGRDLIDRTGTRLEQADTLFYAPFVVVSHGSEADPILNFGNAQALTLWEMTWEELMATPSRLTAEPSNQDERARMLRDAAIHGWIQNYRGVRISQTGKRFLVERATVWNVLDHNHTKVGQAATFSPPTPM